ncbi:hypothetical protein [Sutterella sp.]|uniref:hypothetical protein n=1 Tax=Sutterella sp. TaxID=1981025 RepID=UPI0026DFAF69|nr:hypothetical protein [Sutterella sp.]MDO5530436.1 hypothetical protein [Sutterella sp.]
MSLQRPGSGKGQFFGPALAGVCIAVVLSVPAAAFTARFLGDNYNTRALVYCCFLLWVVCGAVAVFMKTWKSEESRLTLPRILLWFLSVWLWPLLLAASALSRRRGSE